MARNVEFAIGEFAVTAERGMPRMMWIPKLSPSACTWSATDLNPTPPAADGYFDVDGR